MSFKRIIAICMALVMMVALAAGCAAAQTPQATPAVDMPAVEQTPAEPEATVVSENEPDEPQIELVVFAAASMTESMNQIAELYGDVAPNVRLVFNFDSSGTLKTQIQEGADCDIFISAGQKQMNQIDAAADAEINTEGLDFVLQGSRFDIVSNSVVMIVPEGSQKGIASFEDVMTDKVELVALGNSDAPAGQYAQEIYENLGLWDKLMASEKISLGTNVKEVLAQVEAASVDCGVVYSTDAATATGVTVVATAPDGSHKPITYPAAVLNITKNEDAAEAFMEFLKGAECSTVFESIGFSIPER